MQQKTHLWLEAAAGCTAAACAREPAAGERVAGAAAMLATVRLHHCCSHAAALCIFRTISNHSPPGRRRPPAAAGAQPAMGPLPQPRPLRLWPLAPWRRRERRRRDSLCWLRVASMAGRALPDAGLLLISPGGAARRQSRRELFRRSRCCDSGCRSSDRTSTRCSKRVKGAVSGGALFRAGGAIAEPDGPDDQPMRLRDGYRPRSALAATL